jgi:predicted glycosyltransferase
MDFTPAERPRILLYSHDSYGLGHLRRNLRLANSFSESCPTPPAMLLATGSGQSQSFSLPHGADTLKLPAIQKNADGTYHSRTLGVDIAAALRLRSRMLLAAVEAYRPHFILVDHVPAGLLGEMREALAAARRLQPNTKLLVGLRDIIDAPARVEAEWRRDGVEAALRLYDRILVYGDESLGTTAQALRLEQRFPGRVVHTGYVAKRVDPVASTTPNLLVTCGGGGDGQMLLRAVAEWLAKHRNPLPFRIDIVTGPLLSPRKRADLEARLSEVAHDVHLHSFVGDMEQRIADATAIVAMAGYNTTVEILASQRPALLVPREGPRMEQVLRAQLLSQRGCCHMARVAELSNSTLEKFVCAAMEGDLHLSPPPDLGGLARICDLMQSLAAEAFGQPAAQPGTLRHHG